MACDVLDHGGFVKEITAISVKMRSEHQSMFANVYFRADHIMSHLHSSLGRVYPFKLECGSTPCNPLDRKTIADVVCIYLQIAGTWLTITQKERSFDPEQARPAPLPSLLEDK